MTKPFDLGEIMSKPLPPGRLVLPAEKVYKRSPEQASEFITKDNK
jgi:hypothetical protein